MRRAPAHVHRLDLVGVGASVTEVVPGDEPSHAVADDVEPGVPVAAGLREGVQGIPQAASRGREIEAPVVGEDVVGEGNAPKEVEEVGVLGEAEDARQHRAGPEKTAGQKTVAGGGDGKGEGKRQVVVAEGVSGVQPDLRPVGPEQLAPEDARNDDGRGRVR